MPPETPRDYQVGYGKPRRHTRFKRGQSGNPRGRPRESKNLPTLLTEALNERVIVAEDDGRRKITKPEAIITQLVNRSAKAERHTPRGLARGASNFDLPAQFHDPVWGNAEELGRIQSEVAQEDE
jgi:hypothetical protein